MLALVEKNDELLRFVKSLIAFRRRQPNVRRGSFLTGKSTAFDGLPDVSWYGPNGKLIEWNANGPSMTSVFGTAGLDDPAARAVMIMLHAAGEPQRFVVPQPAAGIKWRLFVNTAAPAPNDVHPNADGPAPGNEVTMEHHSLHCYVAE